MRASIVEVFIMGNNKITIDDDNIIRCTIQNNHTESEAESIFNRIEQISQNSQNTMILIDINKIKITTSGSRKFYVNAISTESEFIKTLAFLGSGVKPRVIANFIIQGIKKKDKVRYFEDEEEAVKWLME